MVSTRSRGGRPLPAPRGPRQRGATKYKSNDACHRHALPDQRSKGVEVVSYTRRKPRR